ncbi:hypothetical protein [Micromonospora endolithica]|uniref:Arsenate reductase n=1 Tax=Micromonospora endolithica TaxID=230091 RepID=A0A3A9YZX6_9ACTN|nr:hypothetical protein [Micromonospora endolithica]RKN41495.1 hypothetical protein D7223_24515 [Micromonospora endolithica]TWJ21935.1 hypothetical protein JD76_02049 [Micromonospora endolithica]
MSGNHEWVPEACTLPRVRRPERLVEFDELLTAALRAQERVAPDRLRWELDPTVEAKVRDLTRRESDCCAFFMFAVTVAPESLVVEVVVPPAYVEVLDALAARVTRLAA